MTPPTSSTDRTSDSHTAERMRRWQSVLDRSEALGDELRELIEKGTIADRLEIWDGRS